MSNFYKNRRNKNEMLIILVAAIIGIGGLYYALVVNESTGTEADQWTYYADELEVSSITWEPTSIEWKDGSTTNGLLLSCSYNAETDVVTIYVEGILYTSDSVSDTIVLSDGTNNSETVFALTVNEDNQGLIVIVISVCALLFAVYRFMNRR